MDQGSKEQEGDGDGPPKVEAKVDTGGQPPGIPLKTPSEGFNESTLRRRRSSSKRRNQSESVGSDIPEQKAKESMNVDVFVDVSKNLNSSSQLYPDLNQSRDPLELSTSQILNVDEDTDKTDTVDTSRNDEKMDTSSSEYNPGVYTEEQEEERRGVSTRSMTKALTDAVKIGAMAVSTAFSSMIPGGEKKEEYESLPEETEDEMNADFIFESLLGNRKPDEITVRFHVLVPHEVVKFNIDTDELYIRGINFSKKNLWTEGVKMMVKKSTKRFSLMIGFENLPKSHVIGKKVEYKYNICRSKRLEEWEHLGGFGGWARNRVLWIPNGSEDIYDKYDDCVLLDDEERKQYRIKSTHFLLPSLMKVSSEKNLSKTFAAAKKFVEVVEQHLNGILWVNEGMNTSHPLINSYRNEKDIEELLEKYYNNFFQRMKENSDERVIGSLFYLMILAGVRKHLPPLSEDNYKLIVASLEPKITDGKCAVLEYLRTECSGHEHNMEIAVNMEQSFSKISKFKFFKENPEKIFNVLPTIHFLRGNHQPPSLEDCFNGNKGSQYWGLNKLPIDIMKLIRDHEHGALPYIEQIELLSQVDPLIKFSYMRCLKLEELLIVMSNYSNHFGVECILSCVGTWLHPDTLFSIPLDKLSFVLEKYLDSITADNFKSFKRSTLLNICFIMQHIFKSLIKSHQVNVVLSSLRMLVHVFKYVPDTEEDQVAYRTKDLGHLADLCGDKLISLCPRRGADRLKQVLKHLSMAANIVDKEPLKERMLGPCLHKANEEIHRSASSYNKDELIDAYIDLDPSETHEAIRDALEKSALSAAEKSLSNVSILESLKSIFTERDHAKMSRFAHLLAKLFSSSIKELDTEDKEQVLNYVFTNETMDRLLNQEIKFKGWIQKFFPTTEANQVLKILKRFVKTINDASLGQCPVFIYKSLQSIHDLKQIRKKLEAVLCVYTDPSFSVLDIVKSLRLRCDELDQYEATKAPIIQILNTFNGKLKNYTKQLQEFPDQAYMINMRLSDLIVPRKSEEEAYQFVQIRDIYIRNIHLIKKYNRFVNSCLFRDCIDEAIEAELEKYILPFQEDDLNDASAKEDDYEAEGEKDVSQLFKVLDLGMQKFQAISDELKNGSLSLGNVQKYFHTFWKKEGLDVELNVVEDFFPSEKQNHYWSNNVSAKMKCYFQLSLYTSTAITLHDVAKLLGISRPLKELEKIQSDRMENEPLSSITKEDLECGKLFSEWTKQQINCLEVIKKSVNFIKWLKDHMENFQEFKFFVDLASISAGESDTEVDRVMFMQAAVSAYSALIFDIRPDSSLQDLLRAVQHLFQSLKEDEHIPEKLVDTNRHLAWIKVIKERHGSVETSSLQQVEAINKTGVYVIGNFHQKGGKSLSLRFQQVENDSKVQSKERDYQKQMTTEDLKELQSKLMLISKSSDAAAEVATFVTILTMSIRIEKGIQRLFEAGCNLTRRMAVIVYCDPKKKRKVEIDFNAGGLIFGENELSVELPMLADFIENSLEDWSKHLTQLRIKYPAISFFRTDQLVELAQNVAGFINDGKSISRQTSNLLSKLGTITEEDLDVFKHEEKQDSFVVLNKSVNTTELTVPEIIQMLEDEYDVETQVAEASIGMIYGQKEDAGVQDYFDWALEHQLDEEIVREGILKYRTEVLGINESSSADNEPIKPSLDQYTHEVIQQANAQNKSLKTKLITIWNSFLSSIETEETTDFINLEKLGEGLQTLYNRMLKPINRKFPAYLTPGKPNLIYTTKENIHATTLTLYHHDSKKVLPSIDEVLVVRSCTTSEDVELLCRRAFNDETGNKIYTVLYAEKLSFDISMKVERMLINEEIKNKDYRLVFICCKDNNQHYSYLSTALDKYKAEVPNISREYLQTYLYRNLTRIGSRIDPTSSRIVQSTRAGNGKSLAVRRTAERLNFNQYSTTLLDRDVNVVEVVDWLSSTRLSGSMKNTVYHFDLAAGVGPSKNDLMFNLSVLGGIEDQQGRVWKCDKDDVYMFESTVADNTKDFTSMLPRTVCLGPMESYKYLVKQGIPKVDCLVQYEGSKDLFQLCDEEEFNSSCLQRPAQYLARFHQGQNLDTYFFSSKEKFPQRNCLEILLDRRSCPVEDPTYSELFNFIKFLNFQLGECEKSIFCQLGGTEDWTNLRFKNLVVKFLILMTQDFSTRSLEISDQSSLERPTISQRRRWESSHHPYIFFNEDSTITFFGIKIDRNMNLISPTGTVIQPNIMHQNLYQLLREQNRNDRIPIFIPNDFDSLSDDVKLRTLTRILGVERENLANPDDMNSRLVDPDPSYKLTADNVKKLLATYMRMKAGIPVCIMGETGCGKTRMIKYLCDILRANRKCENLYLMKVHGGLSKQTINQKVTEALEIARSNYNKFNVKITVMFFDEANTTSWIHLIKDIVVDRIHNGVAIPADSTLQFAICVNPYRKHSAEMIQKLENSGLGYHIQAKQTMDRIGDVPLRQLVYRVHPLPISLFPFVWDFGQPSESDEREMVKQMIKNNTQGLQNGFADIMITTICSSQNFLRQCSFESSFVSLRDVDRFLKIFQFLEGKKDLFEEQLTKEMGAKNFSKEMILLLLALGANYYLKLENRERCEFSSMIGKILKFPNNNDILPKVISRCQDIWVDELRLDSDIAKNDALKENVWMMTIMIELKIPLFIVGKPGSSKSLAKTVVCDVMQGQNSYSDIFKNFKEIHMVSFQCSPLATSDGIIGTFRQCQKFQQKKDLSKLTSVVILDEVGLAEDSPKMPLKALHPLLEDGCIEDDKPTPDKKTSFIGISNWALDPAKMNRGILLQRTPPDREDLIKIGRGIGDRSIQQITDPYIPELADGYLEVYNNQEKEYFGLRDFYSLIKMLSAIAVIKNKDKSSLSWKNVDTAVRRNFGGFFGKFNPAATFLSKVKSLHQGPNDFSVPAIDLLKDALNFTAKEKTDSRYILIITKNNAALRILDKIMPTDRKVEVLFGSSFPGDQEYSSICNNINRIKIFMETGVQCVLVNLESLYESLYDCLNQSYSWMGGNRYVDLGLGTHRVKCRVHPDFRLIVVAEDQDVLYRFPIPLINRLEKHYLGMETILPPQFGELQEKLKQWVRNFCVVDLPQYKTQNYKQKTEREVLIGYHEDAISSMIVDLNTDMDTTDNIESQVKSRLLESATPDGIMRLPNTFLKTDFEDVFTEYFVNQNHDSLLGFLNSLDASKNHLVEVTTHSKLLTSSSVKELTTVLHELHVSLESLQQFSTEEDFRKAMIRFFREVGLSVHKKCTLICQVDAGEESARNLIETARQIIKQMMKGVAGSSFNIFLVLHIPFGSGHYIGFPCSPWRSVHIDELRCQHGVQPMMIKKMRGRSITDIIKTEADEELGILPLIEIVESCVPKAASLIKGGDPSRSVERIDKFLGLFRRNVAFQKITLQKICKMFGKKEETSEDPTSWLFKVSLYSSKLKEGSTFQSSVWSHLQDVISPVLASIISNLDANKNLDIMDTKEGWKADLFLQIYRDIELDHNESKAEEIYLPNHGPNKYPVRIGFSWLIIDQMKQFSGIHPESSNVSNILQAFSKQFENGKIGMTEDFIMDLINTTVCIQSKSQGEILQKWVLSEYKSLPTDQRTSPAHDIFSVFQNLLESIGWFIQLTEVYPSIIGDVSDSLRDQKIEQPLNEKALRLAITLLSPDFAKFEIASERQKWLLQVNQISQIAQQMKMINSKKEEVVKDEMWNEWTRVSMFKLFVHHVLSNDINADLNKVVCAKLKQVWMTLKNPDLKKYTSFKKLIQVLKILNVQAAKLHFTGGVNECVRCGDIPKNAVALPCGHVGCEVCLIQFMDGKDGIRRCPAQNCKNPKVPDDFEIKSTVNVVEAVEKHSEFRRKLNLYFLEVLQAYCFTADGQKPESEILQDLLKFVALKTIDGEKQQWRTKEMSPFQEHGIDASPTIRSFLLQLCLQCDRKLADEHIAAFMAWGNLDDTFDDHDEILEFSALFMSCLEDYNTKNSNGKEMTALLTLRSAETFTWNDQMDITDTKKLERLANLRFTIEHLAEAIAAHFDGDTSHEQVIREAMKSAVCKIDNMKKFLVKNLVFKHRSDLVGMMRNIPDLRQFLPDQLLEEDESAHDIFHVSGEEYIKIKTTMKKFVGGSEDEEMELAQYLENNQDGVNVIFQTILSCFDLSPTQAGLKENVLNLLAPNNAVVQTLFDDIEVITDNEASQRSTDLRKLAFMMKVQVRLFPASGLSEMFQALINDPRSVMNKFLPSMPHDVQYEVLTEVGNEYTKAYGTHVKFFVCPNGHVYGIGDCTRPNQAGKCLDCGAPIGAQRYDVLQTGNRELGQNVDQTRTGYIQQGNIKEGVREMTVFETEMVSILLHIGCLASRHLESVATLCQVPLNNVEVYLDQQIQNKIRKVSKLSGMNQDEVLLLVGHLIKSLPFDRTASCDLVQKQGRLMWEKSFVSLLRVCQGEMPRVTVAFKKAVKEDTESSTLQKILNGEDETSNLDKLLRVRFRLSADSLLQWMISQHKVKDAPTLNKMLTSIDVLQELSSLPSILQLQDYLLANFSGKISNVEMENMTISDFAEKIDDNFKDKFMSLSDKLLTTWSRMKNHVFKFGGVMAEELRKLESFTSDVNPLVTPAAFLFPASKGSGLCSYALVMFLINIHNLTVQSDMQPINPYKASLGHLVSITKSDISTLLLAHTSYSIPRKGVTKEEYDIEGMERKLVYRYIKGCPRLEGEIRKVKYLEDRSGSNQRKLTSKIQQEQLPNTVQYQLETEVKLLPDLCRLLESVCTAKDFLLEIGSSLEPDASLLDFMTKLQLYVGEVTNSKGPLRNFHLSHVDSLISFLLLVRAKSMIKNDQNPFEQTIPHDYRVALPEGINIKNILYEIRHHQWLTTNLFNFIWEKLRAQPTGESSGLPDWSLKDSLEAFVEDDGAEYCESIPERIQVKHAVELFIDVNNVIFKCDQK